MADQREALELEAAAHRRTQEQLLQLHETMQKERDAFAVEMAHDRDARAQLPIVLAELASTRKMLDQMSKEAGERLLLGKDAPEIILSSPSRRPAAAAAAAAAATPASPYSPQSVAAKAAAGRPGAFQHPPPGPSSAPKEGAG